jgi:hypothetical protein
VAGSSRRRRSCSVGVRENMLIPVIRSGRRARGCAINGRKTTS